MAFGGEMDENVDGMLAQQPLDEGRVANIADHQFGTRHIGDGRAVACVGQCVEHDEPVAGMPRTPIMQEISADKASATGHKQISQASVPL